MQRVILVVSICALNVLAPLRAAGSESAMPAGGSVQSVPGRSVRLHNYNNWHFDGKSAEELDQKLEIVSRRDNVCYIEYWDRANKIEGWRKITPQTLRQLNPNVRVYRLYALCCKSGWDSDWEDPKDTEYMQTPLTRTTIDEQGWWLLDGDGKLVRESAETWFLDVGKPGFKEAFLQNLLDRLAGKGFDGVVFDYLIPNIITQCVTSRGQPAPSAYPNDDAWFVKAWQPFISYVTDGLRKAGYRIIGNCAGEYGAPNPSQAWQRSKVDGTIYEQGAVNWRTTGGAWLDGRTIERRINALADDPIEVWFANNGIRHDTADFERKVVVSLAMYYVAIPASQEKRSYHYSYDWTPYWQPLWDFYIGVPAEPRVQVHVNGEKKYAWMRKFTEGIVLLNYESGDSIMFSLDRAYRTPDGRRVSGDVRLPPHTGMILARFRPRRVEP